MPAPDASSSAAPSPPVDARAFLIPALWLLTVAGFVIPNGMVVAYLVQDGHGLESYFSAWVDSLPATQLLVDLVIASLAFLAWAAFDAWREGIRWWFAIPATFFVGLCFSLPLYLLHRERSRAAESAVR